MKNKIILIGYSGHAFVIQDIFTSINRNVFAYCDAVQKEYNPFSLTYLENENQSLSELEKNDFFISIGDNSIRKKIYNNLAEQNLFPINAIHANSIISTFAEIQPHGVMVGAGCIINPLAIIGNGVICNTGSMIEHECIIQDFAHIGPGAILCGNVFVGENSFVGAGAVIRQGIKIGKNVMVGAGAVVVKDVTDNTTVMGCPAK